MRDVGILSAHINEHTNIHTEPATIKKKKNAVYVLQRWSFAYWIQLGLLISPYMLRQIYPKGEDT